MCVCVCVVSGTFSQLLAVLFLLTAYELKEKYLYPMQYIQKTSTHITMPQDLDLRGFLCLQHSVYIGTQHPDPCLYL